MMEIGFNVFKKFSMMIKPIFEVVFPLRLR